MAGNLLLSRLSEGNFSHIAEDVQDYLNPVFSGEDRKSALHTFGCFAVKFLHGSVKFLDKSNPGLVAAIHSAFQSFLLTRAHVQLSEPCFLLKVLYHIFMKLSKDDDLVDCLAVSQYILEEVGEKASSDKSVNNIATGVAHALWNKACSIETRQDKPCPNTALKSRHVALKFMVAQKKAIDALTSKICITLIYYQKMSSRTKPNTAVSSSECLLSTVCDDMCNLLTDLYDDPSNSVVIIRLQQFKYLYGCGQVKSADDILVSLKNYCSKDDPGLLSLVLTLCKACACISNLTKSLETNEKKGKLKNISETLGDILIQYESHSGSVDKSFGESQTEELKSIMMILVSSLTNGVQSLLNISWPDKLLAVENLTRIVSILKAQSLICGTICDCDFSKVQKTWGWKIQPNITLSSLFLLQLQCLHSILKLGNVDKNLLSIASQTIKQFETHISRVMADNKPDKFTIFDKDCLGTMAHKFGNLYYYNGDNEGALSFYETACKHHSELYQEENNKINNRTEKVDVWSCYNSLAECYRRLGRYKEAMDTLTKCMTVDRSHVMAAAKLWVKVKRDLTKNEQIPDDVLIMSLCDSVERSGFKVDNKTDFLEAEIKMYQEYRCFQKLHGVELKCVHELQAMAREPQKKAALLVEEGKLLWLNNSLSSQRSTLECFKEAIELTSVGERMTPVIAATSAEAHLWLYICRVEELRKQTSVGTTESKKPCDDTANTDDNGEDRHIVKIKLPCVTLHMENKLLAILDTALSLWERCVGGNKLPKELDISAITQSLQITAAVYYTVEKPVKGLQTLQLLQKFRSAESNTGLSPLTKLFLVRLWSDIDVPSEMCRELDVWNNSSDLYYSLLKAECELRMGQEESCGKIAIELLTQVRLIENRTSESCLLEGCALRLLSKLCITTRSGRITEHLKEAANPLNLAHQAVSCHISVLYHLLGKKLDESVPEKGARPVERWLIVTEILNSLLHLGRTFMLIGFARGAHCYLEEGFELSQSLALPRWCGYFLNELGRFSCMSGCMTDIKVYSQQVREILTSKDDFTALPATETTDHLTAVTKTNVSERKSVGKRNCFGFDSPNVDEEFVLHSISMTMTEENDFEMHSLESVSVYQSCLLEHPGDCVCVYCMDLISHRLQTTHLLNISEYYFVNGVYNHALDTLQLLQKILAKFGSKLSTLIKPLYTAETKKCLKSAAPNIANEKAFMWLSVLSTRVLCGISKVLISQREINQAMLTLQRAEDSLCGFPERMSEVLHLYSDIQVCKARIMLISNMESCESLSSKQMSSPVILTPGASPTGNTENLVKNIENLILDDKKTDERPLEDLSARKTQRGRLSSKKCTKSDKGIRKSGRRTLVVPESDSEDIDTIDLSGDICERLNNLSIQALSTSQRRSTRPEMSESSDKLKYEDRKKKSKNENAKPDDLLPKTTRRRGKLKGVDSEMIATHVKKMSRRPNSIEPALSDEDSSPLQPKKTTLYLVSDESFISGHSGSKPLKAKKTSRRVASKISASGDEESAKPLQSKKSKRNVKTEILSDNSDIKPKKIHCEAMCEETVPSDDENTKPLQPQKNKRHVKAEEQSLSNKSDGKPLKPKKTVQGAKKVGIGHLKNPHAFEEESMKTSNSESILLKPKKTNCCSTPEEVIFIDPLRSKPLQPKKTNRLEIPKEPVMTDNSESKPLQPKKTRGRVSKDPGVMDNKEAKLLQPKKAIRCAIPIKISQPKNIDIEKNVYDFSPDVKWAKTKISNVRDKKQNTTNKVVKSSRTRQSKLGQEVEVSRSAIRDTSDLHVSLQSEMVLADISYEEENSDNSFDFPLPLFDSAVTFQTDSPFESSPIGPKELHFSGIGAPADVSLNSSIELTRAGSDEETTTIRTRRVVRKGPVKDDVKGEDKELPRDSRVADYSEKMKNMLSKRSVKDSYVTPVDVKTKKSDQISGTGSEFIFPSPDDIIENLESLLERLGPFPPLFVYQQLCHQLAQHCIYNSSPKAAFYLAESMSVTLRHRKHVHLAKRQKRLQKIGLSCESTLTSQDPSFGPHTDIINKTMDKLHQDWTVCMISVLEKGCGLAQLVITRLQKGCTPVVKPVISFNSDQIQSVLSQFSDIMEGSKLSMKLTNKTEWWHTRTKLDSSLQELLEKLETEVLKGSKCLLIGQVDKVDTDLPGNLSDPQLIASLKQVSEDLSDKQLCELITCVMGSTPTSDIISAIRQSNQHIDKDTTRKPLILILDKAVQHLPWENIPVLRGHPVCRVTSLHHLYDQLVIEEGRDPSAVREGIDTSCTHYFLNPDNNLPVTQDNLQSTFEKQAGWTGITGQPPSKQQFSTALTNYELLIYSGHGGGSRFLRGDDLQYLDCKATVLLMGCSSGKLHAHGNLEPVGLMHNYALAGCSCVIGNLWDVTDRDIDRLTQTLFDDWLPNDKCKCLAEVLAKSRTSCRLSYLIGSAPVMYGLPVRHR